MTASAPTRPAGRLKLRGLTVTPVRLTLHRPLKMSIATVPERECVVVEAMTDGGPTGLGESVLAPYFTGENVAGAMRAINLVIAPALVGSDVFDLAGASMTMERVLHGNAAAKAAVDVALHDAAARALGIPLYILLGGRVRNRVASTWHVVGTSPQEVADETAAGLGMGFTAVKLKVGSQNLALDLARLDAVCRIVGSGVQVRVDANQAWSPSQAIRFLEATRDRDLQFLEQPVHRDDVAGMARVAASSSTPVAPDEGVYDATGALTYLRSEAAGGFVPKLIKGGITGVRHLAAVADAANVGLHLAGMPGESSICAAAATHLAVALPRLPWDSGISPHSISSDLVQEPMVLIDGCYEPPTGPGIGVSLDRRSLARARIDL
ncbi:MAG TPA: enolase C-terminal domain-like protein [Candidatus Acidoferrales bacterium]|nr:enolase C-terminal domain-like protein [Candidatus Acidoferrales bacterium]